MEAFWGLLIHFPLAFPVHTHTHTPLLYRSPDFKASIHMCLEMFWGLSAKFGV